MKHGGTLGGKATREYQTWKDMRKRCTNPKALNYAYYGGRGITVCARWGGEHGFEHFLADMGPKPSAKHSIDRIDGTRGYSPDNCRWATPVEQAHNMRSTKLDEFKVRAIRALAADGYSQRVLARHFGVTSSNIHGVVNGYKWRTA